MNLREAPLLPLRPAQSYRDGKILTVLGDEIKDDACWHDFIEKWEEGIHKRKSRIVSNEIRAIRTGLWGDDVTNLITASMSIWEMACERENIDFFQDALLPKICSLLSVSNAVSRNKYVIASSAAALWMITCQCRGNR